MEEVSEFNDETRSGWFWLNKFFNNCVFFWCFHTDTLGGKKMSRKCVNKYIPDHVDQHLKWYKRDGFLTYIDVLKYKDFIRNPDAHFKNA